MHPGLLPEHLGGEGKQLGPGPPAIGRKTRLAAHVGEEFRAIPPVLRGHLRKEKASSPPLPDHQSVHTHFDLLGTRRDQRSQDGDFDMDRIDIGRPQRGKPRILRRSRDGALLDGPEQGGSGFGVPDASPEPSFLQQRHEGGTRRGQPDRRRCFVGHVSLTDERRRGAAGDREQLAAVLLRQVARHHAGRAKIESTWASGMIISSISPRISIFPWTSMKIGTISGSNCTPEQRRISAFAVSRESAFR